MGTFKFAKSLKFVRLSETVAFVKCGTQLAVVECYDDNDTMGFTYSHGEHLFFHEYAVSKEGVENAIWEWLCTLSRFIDPNCNRTLGSMRKAMGDGET